MHQLFTNADNIKLKMLKHFSFHDDSIALNHMQEWPLRSKLDPEIYGPQESAITAEMVEQEIKGFMTCEQV